MDSGRRFPLNARRVGLGGLVGLVLVTACATEAAGPVADVIRRLASRDASVRRRAVIDLDGSDPAMRRALPAVLRIALEDPEPYLRQNAARTIGEFPNAESTIPELARALQSPEVERRWSAALVLESLGPRAAAAAPALIEASKDTSSQVRSEVIEALCATRVVSEASLAVLVEALGDPKRVVQIVAMCILSSDDAAAWQAVVAALEHPNPTVRRNALVTLNQPGTLDRPDVLSAIERAAQDPDPAVAQLAAGLSARMKMVRQELDAKR